jgi:hypothetical protein
MAGMKPKLTLRDLFWLVLVVGLVLGWWLQNGQMKARQTQFEATIEEIYQDFLVGERMTDMLHQHRLKSAPVWHTPNLPPGANAEATYFLNEGNLTVWFTGDSGTVSKVEFRLSDRSVKERTNFLQEDWNDWVEAHSE